MYSARAAVHMSCCSLSSVDSSNSKNYDKITGQWIFSWRFQYFNVISRLPSF